MTAFSAQYSKFIAFSIKQSKLAVIWRPPNSRCSAKKRCRSLLSALTRSLSKICNASTPYTLLTISRIASRRGNILMYSSLKSVFINLARTRYAFDIVSRVWSAKHASIARYVSSFPIGPKVGPSTDMPAPLKKTTFSGSISCSNSLMSIPNI